MVKPRGCWVWVFMICWLASLAAGAAWAKNSNSRAPVAQPEEKSEKINNKKTDKKAAKKSVKKGKKTEPEPPAAVAPRKPAGIADPKVLLTLAREQENGGDIFGCLQSLAKFVNVYPRHPERAATLQRMARLARDRGQQDKALQIFALAASLYPNSQAGVEARWQVHNLEFFQNLQERDPLASLKDYLLKVKSLPPGASPENLREPLRRGWLAVAQVLRRTSPCPVHLVEEALALWELHPRGTQPPEAALVLGELLQENGLYAEARGYLEQARDHGSPGVRTQALLGLLEAAWVSRALPDFAAAWMQWRLNKGEITPILKSRLDKLPLPEALFAAAPGPGQERQPEDALAALLDWWSGKSPDPSRQEELLRCLEHFLSRPLPPAMKERLLRQLARLQWSQGHYPQAARIYQQLLAANTRGENSAFYQDRLALSQLQGQRQEAALEIYRGLSREGDNFWQLVSRTRLADVELGRLQMEPLQ